MIKSFSSSANQTKTLDLDIRNVLAALRRCAPNFETIHCLSFQSVTPKTEQEWGAWCETTMRAKFLPVMRDVYTHALEAHVREIMVIDNTLAEECGIHAEKCCREGRRLLLSQIAPQSERALQKYLQHVETGKSVAHFVVVYTLRAAVFHIPLSMVIKSYLFLEATIHARQSGTHCPEELMEKFYRSSEGASSKKLRAA
ncbi:MAG: hypothetical protein ABI443_13025 [Chthoniobacterales bacterium]